MGRQGRQGQTKRALGWRQRAVGARLAHLVDKLHDALTVAELHHSGGRRVQAVGAGHHRWLGHAHEHHPLSCPVSAHHLRGSPGKPRDERADQPGSDKPPPNKCR